MAIGRGGRNFEITVVETSHVGQVCARLNGELDIDTVVVARERIDDLTRDGRNLVLDLRGLTFIDAYGVYLMFNLANESIEEGWKLSLISGSSVVQRIFELTGTRERLPFKVSPESWEPASADPPSGRALRR
ncbi:MAG TPA: STAS domain-containing protein [Solirubrobacteraceae bacterium]|jgi:anti-sigma B factor antagonist|nr:STAS domain-containing protein [Solirubrobacteraceae bacterium]